MPLSMKVLQTPFKYEGTSIHGEELSGNYFSSSFTFCRVKQIKSNIESLLIQHHKVESALSR